MSTAPRPQRQHHLESPPRVLLPQDRGVSRGYRRHPRKGSLGGLVLFRLCISEPGVGSIFQKYYIRIKSGECDSPCAAAQELPDVLLNIPAGERARGETRWAGQRRSVRAVCSVTGGTWWIGP